MPAPEPLTVRVAATRLEARAVTSFELVSPDGSDLPAWEPGAHIDVYLPSGAVRQYSLCGDPADRRRYRIAVLALPDGRGGSVEAHRELRAGQLVDISGPRSNFTLIDADRYVFVAGGIGITPLLPMIRQVAARGIKWELVYGARSQAHLAFTDELGEDTVRLVPEDRDGRIDLDRLVTDSAGAVVYCCGPAPLMDALAARMDRAGRGTDLHLERFSAATPPVNPDSDGTFELELARSGLVLSVPPEQSVLEAVRAAGVDHPSSCEMGICGTCETAVLAGEIDHRDDLYTDEERAAGTNMLICVSRAKGCSRLVVDL